MRKLFFILSFMFSFCCVFSQQMEPARYEKDRWKKDQGCCFESFGEKGGIMVSQTDRTNDDKGQLWEFALVDSSLYEVRSDLIPLPSKMVLHESSSNENYAVFLFTGDKERKSDTMSFCAVCFNRKEQTYKSFGQKLPDKSIVLSASLLDATWMLSVNDKTGGGSLFFYDLESGSYRSSRPSVSDSYVLFQAEPFENRRCFVIAAREYENKHYVATSFLLYSPSGTLLRKFRYENGTNACLGRMCFDFDANGNLVVIGTLEREGSRNVTLEGLVGNFDKVSVGVIWIKFDAETSTKAYLFKNMPEIELALDATDRVKVREERVRSNKKKDTKKEIAFQFLQPRLLKYDEHSIFALEAFVPQYHSETRMDYGFYGMYPYTYTVFDGYDFISEVLLAFDNEGNLKWQTSVKFDNELTYELLEHSVEAVCHGELIVASSYKNALRYVVFNNQGRQILSMQSQAIEPMFGADYVEDEYFAQVKHWFGSRFFVFGSQIIQNGVLAKPRRSVFFLQKIQYD